MMTLREIANRAGATFVQAFTGELIAAGFIEEVSDMAIWERAGLAGAAAVVTVVHRAATRWLDRHPVEDY